MKQNHPKTQAAKFFWKTTAFPKTIIFGFILVILGLAIQMPKMKIDTSIEAYIPPGHHSLVNRDRVRDVFGLTDPIVVAISSSNKYGVFTPRLLNVVSQLTEQIQQVTGVDPEQVTSLATENNITGTVDGMIIEPFIDGELVQQSVADHIKKSVMGFPLYIGNIVSEDASTTLIVAELLDKNKYGPQAYNDIKMLTEDLLNSKAADETFSIHVAGEGGVVAHLAEYIDKDAQKMGPMAFTLIILILILAYRTFRGLYLSVIVILGAVIGAMGIMAASGVPMYQVSNVIPVILIAISVADAIHILGQYYENLANDPGLSRRELVVRTMEEMWRPVTLTSITDVLGFLAMGFTSSVPPLRMVGIFSSVGVIIALLISLFLIPAILVLLKPRLSKAFLQSKTDRSEEAIEPDLFGRLMVRLGAGVLRRPKVIVGVAGIVVIAGLVGIPRLRVDEASIENFNTNTAIYKADRLINAAMNGANSFDVMVETKEVDGLLAPDHLKKIEAMQTYIEQLPEVGGTTSIVDLLKQMNKSLHENSGEAYVLPDRTDLTAQYFLLYSASGDPSDFEQYIDYDYRMANISVSIKDGHYARAKPIIEAVDEYIQQDFNDQEMTASIAGWMNVFYYWVGSVGHGHFAGVILALILVWAITAFGFKSLVAGLFAVTPVFTAIFVFYAVMGFSGITLNTATSMFAAIAIGVAVDFAVHLIDRMIHAVKEQGQTIDEALSRMFPSTGRALLFNVAAVSLGFGSNMISSIPPFITFGALITTCVATSFLASVTLLPAMIKVFKPEFLTRHTINRNKTTATAVNAGFETPNI